MIKGLIVGTVHTGDFFERLRAEEREKGLGEEYDIVEAENGLEGVVILQKMGPEISLVLLDIVMPEMDGFGLLATMNQNRYSIEEVLEVCWYYFQETGRRISFEYSLVQGVNDRKEHAAELAKRLRGRNCHVNLIPVNPIKERDFRQTRQAEVLEFKKVLEKNGINVTIRREMGRDIQGACGQLRKGYQERQQSTKEGEE